MKHRTLDEMISYFNQQVSKMDIKHEDKMKLLGMITAIGLEDQTIEERKIGALPSAQPVIRGIIDESGRIKFIEQPEIIRCEDGGGA